MNKRLYICRIVGLLVATISNQNAYGMAESSRDNVESHHLRNTHNRARKAIRRIYSPENAHVHAARHELEQTSTHYWRTGHRLDPHSRTQYHNHPYELMERERQRRRVQLTRDSPHLTPTQVEMEADRNLQSVQANSTAFQPMRIQFFTGALDQQRNAENGAQIDFIKNEILPRTGQYWSDALSVVPVSSNLFIDAGELSNRLYCGDSEFTEVPSEHIADGIPDVDLILYVSGKPSTRFCGPSTLAVAVACNFDRYDRPTAGAINFCLDQVQVDENGSASEAIIEDNVDVAIHEAAHVLGMSSNSYRYFYDSDTGKPRTNRNFRSSTVTCVDGVERTLILPNENTLKFFIASNGQRYASIVTPKVQAVARNQFDCQTLAGAQLEVSYNLFSIVTSFSIPSYSYFFFRICYNIYHSHLLLIAILFHCDLYAVESTNRFAIVHGRSLG